jgi:hypothetical protein
MATPHLDVYRTPIWRSGRPVKASWWPQFQTALLDHALYMFRGPHAASRQGSQPYARSITSARVSDYGTSPRVCSTNQSSLRRVFNVLCLLRFICGYTPTASWALFEALRGGVLSKKTVKYLCRERGQSSSSFLVILYNESRFLQPLRRPLKLSPQKLEKYSDAQADVDCSSRQ